jgi:hypothetical protein
LEKIEGERQRDTWIDGHELALKVISALDRYIQDYPDNAKGWVPGDAVPAAFEASITTILEPCKSQGITLVSQHGIAESPRMMVQLKFSRQIRIMVTNGDNLFEIYRLSLIQALMNGADIRVLVPKPGSDFVKDVEESESIHVKRKGFDQRIMNVEVRLKDCLEEARSNSPASLGTASVGFFTTHLRSTMVLCEDWGWLTITLPPLRATETVSFEIERIGENSLLSACIRHFDCTWDIVKARNDVKQV